MKLYMAWDSRTGLAHSAAVTAANVHDKHLFEDMLHGDERRVYATAKQLWKIQCIEDEQSPGQH